MPTLNEWIDQYADTCCHRYDPYDRQWTEHVVREAFPMALEIIRACAPLFRGDSAISALKHAEQIINEEIRP